MKWLKVPNWRKIDYLSLFIMVVLLGVGSFCLRQQDILSGGQDGLYKKQLIGIAIGGVVMIATLFVDYRFICQMSPVLYAIILLLLTYTITFAGAINNVKRWIKIGSITIQPSELTKIVLILFIAFLCNLLKDRMDEFKTLFILGAAVAVPLVLILLEPHLSSSMVIVFIFVVMVFMAGISYRLIGIVMATMVPILLFIFIGVGVYNIKVPLINPYQVQRIMTYFSDDEEEDTSGKYQQNQALVAIATGGKNGKAIDGESNVRAYSAIYANESDFIFSAVGEEFGFVGSSIIIFLFFIMVVRCLSIAAHAPDFMGKLVCMGVSAMLLFQLFANIGVATSILPNTGLPLPFISSGLTSLVTSMSALGIVINVGMHKTPNAII
ncbi:MAG: FtsW/RodA/SpoVE family cell cycle protein [bacterium]|nr:FtsW/RodA/SpoVE family cell cycle protein [bacterium]